MDKRDREILQFTVDAGILLLANGAETFRAQQTMVYIAKNLGAEGCEAYVLTNGIIASLKGDSAHAQVRHSPRNGMHMGRVEAINEMSREIANGVLDLDGAKVRLEQVRAMPDMTVRDQVLACAAGSVCFGYIFGGNVLECLIAGAVGGMVQYAMVMLARTGMNRIFARLASAAMLVCAVSLVQVICPWLDVETTAIGALALYISDESIENFQPMNINFSIVQPLEQRIRKKAEKNLAIANRSLAMIDELIQKEKEVQ